MKSKKQKKGGKPPTLRRWIFIACILATFGLGVLLDRVVLPDQGAHLTSTGTELPMITTISIHIATFFNVYWWAVGIGALLLTVLARMGAFDRKIGVSLSFGVVLVLIMGSATATSWNTNENLVAAVESARR